MNFMRYTVRKVTPFCFCFKFCKYLKAGTSEIIQRERAQKW